MTRCMVILISRGSIGLAAFLAAAALRGGEDQVTLFQSTLTGGQDLTDGRYRDLKYRNDQWYGSTFFAGPDWTRVGKEWHHPGHDLDTP